MPIPDFVTGGILPTGIYDCDLAEIESKCVYNNARRLIWDAFKNYLSQLVPVSEVDVIYVNGSFTTNKEPFYDDAPPSDIDVVLEFPDVDTLYCLYLLHGKGIFHRESVKANFHIDLWFADVQGGMENDLRKFFTYVRVEDALARSLTAGTEKGILRISLRDEQRNGTI